MNTDLPEFDVKIAKQQALPFAKSIFGEDFIRLEIADAGSCRVTFKPSYFVMQGDNTEPSKSQWSTLKKKLKRHNRGVFVFKETGDTNCHEGSEINCHYIDFGFYKY